MTLNFFDTTFGSFLIGGEFQRSHTLYMLRSTPVCSVRRIRVRRDALNAPDPL